MAGFHGESLEIVSCAAIIQIDTIDVHHTIGSSSTEGEPNSTALYSSGFIYNTAFVILGRCFLASQAGI